ncbi:hypothetical protein OH76DRAFT_1455974 [Lentinus brumalis]|uniref:Arrestin C-terminal-like domain-containing protein n=1 Tax=Lentinus brumalis TaxID=2498619 RepID=A0A371D9U2_9APHY|nr:hypothetical protein OH76DRAFT_1455974 [Polyporus brumalis]
MPTSTKPAPSKNALDIRLAESVVFLRAGDATGRQRTMQADASPGMVRGLLVLTLAKPTRITSIEVELVGRTVTAWPEGVGARRIEITEEHDIYSQSYVFFRAGHAPGSGFRRNVSVGPGLALEHEDEDHSERSSYMQHDESRDGSRGRSPPPRDAATVRRPRRRHMSVDQTHYQRSFVSHHDNGYHPPVASPPYTPTYSQEDTVLVSPTASIINRSSLPMYDESPARSLEDLRRALEAEQYYTGLSRSPSRQGRSSSGMWSPREVPDSRRVSFDDDREFQVGSSTSHLQHAGPSHSLGRDGRTPSRQRDGEGDDTVRGRKGKFSFASAFFEAMKDRVRSRSPMVERGGDITPPRGRTRDRAFFESGDTAGTPLKERSALGRVAEAVGLEVEDGQEHGDGWKEFRKGVYTYPVSFTIPANSPPSLHVDYGSVTWKLKAVVHRPGAFKQKLTASQDITVVTTPGEDDTEESESIVVERQWDTQMQYLIMISGRSFAIGGTMPVSITFMPWTKMKIHRISVLIEERVDYWTGFRRVARTDPINRVPLLALKYPKKDGPALLPLTTDDPEAFRQSPLNEILNPDDDVSETVSSFMGPGPWTIRKELHLPKAEGTLHTTNKNKRSNISVSHMLKIIFRVERGDDSAVDPQTGKRKLFDIVVQTPVHILSHLCNPEHTALPPYSQVPNAIPPHAALSVVSDGDICTRPPTTVDLGAPAATFAQRRSVSTFALAAHASSTTSSLSGRGRSPGNLNHLTSDQSVDSLPTSSEQHISPTATVISPPLSRRQSFQERTTPELFERLIAGQETEEGEAPPSYEAAVEAAHPVPVVVGLPASVARY